MKLHFVEYFKIDFTHDLALVYWFDNFGRCIISKKWETEILQGAQRRDLVFSSFRQLCSFATPLKNSPCFRKGAIKIRNPTQQVYINTKIMNRVKWFVKMLMVIAPAFAQAGVYAGSQDWHLEKMPADLERDFALSSLPPDLRDQATLYLLDPEKGYYMAKQGTNGFSAIVLRTEWERADFVQDTYSAISFDAEGSKIYLPVYFDVAQMRASGKYSASQVKDSIIQRVKDGVYKAPSRTGVSYMLSPLLRTYNDGVITNVVLPHYMFYAPRVDNDDIGGKWDGHRPFAIGSQKIFDKEHSIFNFIIIPAGDMEKAKIVEANKDLLSRLAAYKPYLKVESEAMPATHNH